MFVDTTGSPGAAAVAEDEFAAFKVAKELVPFGVGGSSVSTTRSPDSTNRAQPRRTLISRRPASNVARKIVATSSVDHLFTDRVALVSRRWTHQAGFVGEDHELGAIAGM